jgi:hypothetical protein
LAPKRRKKPENDPHRDHDRCCGKAPARSQMRPEPNVPGRHACLPYGQGTPSQGTWQNGIARFSILILCQSCISSNQALGAPRAAQPHQAASDLRLSQTELCVRLLETTPLQVAGTLNVWHCLESAVTA